MGCGLIWGGRRRSVQWWLQAVVGPGSLGERMVVAEAISAHATDLPES